MDIISDYTNWKFENYNLINTLIKLKSNIIRRFPHVLIIADYFYDLNVNKHHELDSVEEVIFSSAFNYLHEHFETISIILEKNFNGNIQELDKISKTINLLIYTNDFQRELDNLEDDHTNDKKKLADFETSVLKYIEAHLEAPDEMFGVLSDLTNSMFDEYYGVNDVLFDVAVELDLVPEDDDDLNIML